MSSPRPTRPSRPLTRSRRLLVSTVAVGAVTALVGLGVAGTAAAAPAPAHHDHRSQTVYTLTNDPAGNQVLAFHSEGGVLAPLGSFPTGGLGTGAGLGSQGAVIVAGDRLFAVNAGTDDISSFRIRRDGSLVLTDREPTGGDEPVSITEHDGVVYVLNGGDESVTGLRVRGNGDLRPIPGARQVLTGAGAAEIAFDRGGDRLVVSEKASNTLTVLPVRHGVVRPGVVTASAGATPFGFAIDHRNHVLVTNAEGGAAGASSVSSYAIAPDRSLQPVSPQVATTQTSACWIALTEDERFAYDTNAASGTISQYSVGKDGSLSLVNAIADAPGAGAADIALAGPALYALIGGTTHVIVLDLVQADGSLVPTTAVAVPVGAVGLAVA